MQLPVLQMALVTSRRSEADRLSAARLQLTTCSVAALFSCSSVQLQLCCVAVALFSCTGPATSPPLAALRRPTGRNSTAPASPAFEGRLRAAPDDARSVSRRRCGGSGCEAH